MGTRGLYGFRKNGQDKLTYNHWDSYPNGLGAVVVNFITNHTKAELNELCDSIQFVNADDAPWTAWKKEQFTKCGVKITNNNGESMDYYWILHDFQGEPEKLFKFLKDNEKENGVGYTYMINSNSFIKTSLHCEYAYIINLDENILEYWVGFQTEPDESNRYGTNGTKYYEDMPTYYPCKRVATFPLETITADNTEYIIGEMNILAGET